DDDNITDVGGTINASIKIPAGKKCCVSISMGFSLITTVSVTLKVGDTTYGPLAYSGYYGVHYFGISNGELVQSTNQDVWFITESEIVVTIEGQRALSSVVVSILIDSNSDNS
ncbi:MAG: hypothetical protein ACI4Q9_02550, partial [Candidatus Methanomethylophilaceae archaeon]